MLEYLIFLAVGLAAGFAAGWFAARQSRKTAPADQSMALDLLTAEKENLEKKLEEARVQINSLTAELSAARENNRNLNERLDQQLKQYEELQKQLTAQFENIASKILDSNTRKLTEQNREKVEELLKPVQDKLHEFNKTVQETYTQNTRERSALMQQVKSLMEMSRKISEDAGNLAKALKGESKTQGNFGEMQLELLLERSGLQEGIEYSKQESLTTTDGRRLQPDFIVHLPDKKDIVIDAKVSLTAYERFVNEENPEKKKEYLKEHIRSVRNHIKELSEKNYQNLYQLQSLDFVLLYLPVEGAFALAVTNDNDLFSFAYDRNIVLVSSSTLLATLKTIASIWRTEKQNRNAVEIARKAGALYDKFANFVKDMLRLGAQMETARSTYDSAMKKLKTGTGNLVRRAEELKKLGAKTTRQLPENFEAEDEAENGQEDVPAKPELPFQKD